MVIVIEGSWGPKALFTVEASSDPTILIVGWDDKGGSFTRQSKLGSEGPSYAIVSDGYGQLPLAAFVENYAH